MCACVASVIFWFVNHLKVIVQQHFQVLFSFFGVNEQCIGTSVVDCPLAGMGDVIFLAFLLVLEIQNQLVGGVSRAGDIYLLEDLDLVVD
jgi:hypothetical protein